MTSTSQAITTATMSTRTVHLIGSWAPLLSGMIEDCQTPDDETCAGGVAAVGAFRRHRVPQNESSVVVPLLDKSSPFAQMHPLGWSVNRLVLQHVMGWNVFLSMPSLLTKVDYGAAQKDITDLQSKQAPLLLTNVAVPPSNSWMLFTEPVHLDDATGLAILSIANSNNPLNQPQIESTMQILDIIARMNSQLSCTENDSLFDSYIRTIMISRNTTNSTSSLEDSSSKKCWIPVIFYADGNEQFEPYWQAVAEHENPPALILDIEGNAPPYDTPRRVGSKSNVWLLSYFMYGNEYRQHVITIDGVTVTNVTLILDDLNELPVEYKDDEYRGNIQSLRILADEAAANNPIVGSTSTEMPATRFENYRRCKAGECESGNLFNDAARWWASSDVAISNSGGFRGPGWPAGPVRVNDIWATLPFGTCCAVCVLLYVCYHSYGIWMILIP
jgi:5'-nucleotidase, C-terminal domain